MLWLMSQNICDRPCKTNHVHTKTEITFIAQDYSYTQELSMHSVSTGQCERVCFSGGHFADPVMIMIKNGAYSQGTNWTGHDLELFPLLVIHFLGLVVRYELNVATFDGFSCSKQCLYGLLSQLPPLPFLPLTHPLAPLV